MQYVFPQINVLIESLEIALGVQVEEERRLC